MADSIYRVTEVIGTSTESWEDAARSAVEDGHVAHYRARVNISFKYETG